MNAKSWVASILHVTWTPWQYTWRCLTFGDLADGSLASKAQAVGPLAIGIHRDATSLLWFARLSITPGSVDHMPLVTPVVRPVYLLGIHVIANMTLMYSYRLYI